MSRVAPRGRAADQEVDLSEIQVRTGQCAQAVAREMDHYALGMARGQPSRLLHVCRHKYINGRAVFDLLTEQTGGPELRCIDRVGLKRKAMQEVHQGCAETACAH
jgi:hypothetical protein